MILGLIETIGLDVRLLSDCAHAGSLQQRFRQAFGEASRSALMRADVKISLSAAWRVALTNALY